MIPAQILNYQVIRCLGHGGMGTVFLAVNKNIDQKVAIKMLNPELAENTRLRQRFKNEAMMLCSLDHPNIVKFLNYVENQYGVFLIMEYVEGVTLEDFITKRNGLIVEKRAYPMICEMLDAFNYAHQHGIVHRDIKPSNIFLNSEGHIKVLDFGIAQIINESNSTESRIIMGTPEFMSPEQVHGRLMDKRSDIYSLGVLVHQMLTGRAPYDSTTLSELEIKRRVTKEVLPRMKDYYPYVSEGMQRVVDKATAKDPENRFQSCADFKKAVKDVIDPAPIPKILLYSGIAALVLVLGISFGLWNYFHTSISYYRDFVECYGVPQGIGELSSHEHNHACVCYRFESSKGKVRRVSFVNSHDKLVKHSDSETVDKPIDMLITYNEDNDKVDYVKYLDCSGKVLYVKDYDERFKSVTFRYDDDEGTEMTLASNTTILFRSAFDNSNMTRSRISKYLLTLNEDGYVTHISFAGYKSARVPDGQGIYGYNYVLDEKGRILEIHYLGKNGEPKSTNFGLGIKKISYSEDDDVVGYEYLTVDGSPASDGNNCPIVKLKYDEYGNRLSEEYFDKNGNRMVRKDAPFAGLIYEYNDDGENVKRSYIGVDGKTAYVNCVCGCSMSYDENGYLSCSQYFRSDGSNAYLVDGENGGGIYSAEKMENDEHGNVVQISYLDANGNLADAMEIPMISLKYDSVGNEVSRFFCNKKGEKFEPASQGIAGYKMQYDSKGRMTLMANYGADNNLKKSSISLYCIAKYDYDTSDNLKRVSYFDETGINPVTSNEGISSAVYDYDENGNEIKRSFYNVQGHLCALNGAYAELKSAYDDSGNTLTERYLDSQERLMLYNKTVGYNYQYDEKGNVTSVYPVGFDGKLAPGQLETRKSYDKNCNVLTESYYGRAGLKVSGPNGYHQIAYKYNSTNQISEATTYNTTGHLTVSKNTNCACTRYTYDNRGNRVITISLNSSFGKGYDANRVYKYVNEYDDKTNQICHQVTYDENGKPCSVDGGSPEGRCTYDILGNRTSVSCFNGYGKKINGSSGWHEMRMTYNNQNKVKSTSYYNVNGNPCLDKSLGCHKNTNDYNGYGNLIKSCYYGVNGRLKLCAQGYAIVKYGWDGEGRNTMSSYFGTKGESINVKGIHKLLFSYKNGQNYRTRVFDATGRLLGTFRWTGSSWALMTS